MKERKYKSIWQVLNARNDLESKYDVIESIVDGLNNKHEVRLRHKVISFDGYHEGDQEEYFMSLLDEGWEIVICYVVMEQAVKFILRKKGE